MATISNIYHNKGYETEIIGDAVRTGREIGLMAELDIDIITCGLSVLEDSFTHPYTTHGIGIFCDAWDHTKGN